MLSSLKTDKLYYPFYEVMQLVLIPGEAFCLFDSLYSTVHFEVSSWDQSIFLQNDLNIKDFEWQIINLVACSMNPVFMSTCIFR